MGIYMTSENLNVVEFRIPWEVRDSEEKHGFSTKNDKTNRQTA